VVWQCKNVGRNPPIHRMSVALEKWWGNGKEMTYK
jgi:hypothetical protein